MCVCVCVRYQFVQKHMLLSGFLLLYLCIFECVCVHLRAPIAPHTTTWSKWRQLFTVPPTLLSQQVAPNVLFSLRKLLAFLLFLCSYLSLFCCLSLVLSHFLSRRLSLCSVFSPASRFFSCEASHFFKWLFGLSHQFCGQQKDS